MNQTLVTSIGDKNVYLINDKNVPFYICIPKNNKVSIVINLVDDVNAIRFDNKNVKEVGEVINNIYNKFNYDDIVVVSPILDSNLLEQVKLSNDGNCFMYLDKFMGYLINTVYGILRNSGMEVDNVIKFSNNINYKIFNEWFVKKYAGRVELVSYIVPLDVNSNESEKSNKGNVIANQVLDDMVGTSNGSDDNANMVSNVKEPGFVSYVLLGVIVAVISLVVLYMLL